MSQAKGSSPTFIEFVATTREKTHITSLMDRLVSQMFSATLVE